MNYEIKLKPEAIKDLENLPAEQSKRVLRKLENFSIDLEGDLKKLTNFTPEYRLRIGDYRVLFEIEENTLMYIELFIAKRLTDDNRVTSRVFSKKWTKAICSFALRRI